MGELNIKTSDQKFYKVGGQVKAEIDVYITREWDGVPSIEQCRHAVLTVRHKGADGQMTDGYVVYDRLLCRIVNGVFYGSPNDALDAAQLYNEDPGQPQDMAPSGRALGLLYPKASS